MNLHSSERRAWLLLMLLRLLVPLAAPMLLAACGDLPEPFLGNPGAMGRRLAVPMTPMLAVPPPSNALLDPRAGTDFADLLAVDLQKEEVPSLARRPRKTDWRLAVSAGRKGDQVVPRYAILDPSGHEQGAIDGAAVPVASWTAGAPWTLGAAAQDAVPKILALMMSVRATRDRANPNSLLNRTAKLFVPEVTGAPGDGNPVLTRLIRAQLAEFGPLVQVTPEGADFTVTGLVVVTPLPKGQQQVEIAWTVTRPSGVVVGKVSQLNSVPAGSLDSLWGDVAAVVAQEASGGINTVVERFIGRDAAAQGKVPPEAAKPPAPDQARSSMPAGSGPPGSVQPAGTVASGPPDAVGIARPGSTEPGGTASPGIAKAAGIVPPRSAEPGSIVPPMSARSAVTGPPTPESLGTGATRPVKPVVAGPDRSKSEVTGSPMPESAGIGPARSTKPAVAGPDGSKSAVTGSLRPAKLAATRPVRSKSAASGQPKPPKSAGTDPFRSAEPAGTIPRGETKLPGTLPPEPPVR